MVAKTHLSDDDLHQILSHYELGDYEDAQPFAGGTVQSNYLLKTAKGKFVLKYYENRSEKSVRFEANVVNYLRQRDFPCAKISKTRSGKSVGLYNHKPYVIFGYIAGHHVENLTPHHQRQIIHTAATLQIITKNYTPYLRQFRWNYSPELCYLLAQERAEKIGGWNAHAKLKWFEKTLADLQLPNSLPKGICHCDYHFSNTLFKDDVLIALLDFDDANYTYLIYDLGHFLNDWSWEYGEDFDPTFARQIAAAYGQTRELSPLEMRHLFDVHKLDILMDGIWFFARGEVADFYERQKIEYLNNLGRERYYQSLFT